MELQNVLTCPNCGEKNAREMPTDSCEYFWTCEKCGQRITPLPGDCCVYCSYGERKCPSKQ
nr:GDCCVxC domain-containing (seleno)protein [Aurantimicrobium minutum]